MNTIMPDPASFEKHHPANIRRRVLNVRAAVAADKQVWAQQRIAMIDADLPHVSTTAPEGKVPMRDHLQSLRDQIIADPDAAAETHIAILDTRSSTLKATIDPKVIW